MDPLENLPSDTFLIAEYESLRREIELEIKELGEFLRYGFVTSGGVWAWLLTQQSKTHIILAAFFIPFIVTVLLHVEVMMVRQSIFGVGAYLRRIEQHFALPDGLGWERHLLSTRRKKQWLMKWEHLVWNLLILANLGAAIYMAVSR